MAVQVHMTAKEFLALPESNLPSEFIHGEVIMSPAPTLEHQRLFVRLFDLIRRLIPNGEVLIAPVDVYLDDENIVQPDIFWVAAEGKCVSVEGRYLRGAPDLIVEIFSPGSTRRDKKDKFRLYEKHGVREYWMVAPDDKWLEAWQLQEGHYSLIDIFGPGDSFASPLLGAVDMKSIFPE
jgi:Uma2 family endonuclease